MIRCLPWMFLLMGVILLGCNDAPEINFPEFQNDVTVTGRVLPATDSVTVYLVGIWETDSTKLNVETGMYRFENVAYGSYLLRVTAPGYGTFEKWIDINERVVGINVIELSPQPRMVVFVRPSNGTKINAAFLSTSNYATDSTIWINIDFREKMDTASVLEALEITPALRGVHTRWASLNDLYVYISRWELDTLENIELTIDQSAKSIYDHHLEMDFTLSYPVDSIDEVIDSITFPWLITSCTPGNGDRNVQPDASIKIQFDTLVDEESFERAFAIVPERQAYFNWEALSRYSRVTIGFINGLMLGTKYKVSLDDGWHAIDSAGPGRAYSFQFATEDARVTKIDPQNGEEGVNTRNSLKLYFNFKPDYENIRESLTIDPAVDSLEFTYYDRDNEIRVSHAPFDSGTVYTITIDTTLKTGNGVSIYRTFSSSFVTQYEGTPWKSDTTAQPEPEEKRLWWESDPADTTREWPVNRAITISFGNEMNVEKLESLLVVHPSFSYYTVWSHNEVGTSFGGVRRQHSLEIIPRHYLQSNTLYSVHIDSGYCALDSVKNDTITFSFTTMPLRCIGHSPAYGERNVPTGAPFSFTFNMPVDTATLNSAISFTPALTHSLKDTVAVDKETGAWKYLLEHNPLLSDTAYEITVDTTITDLFGCTMERGFPVEFTTGN